jgi:GNAT superfamily N-acetyltransferase
MMLGAISLSDLQYRPAEPEDADALADLRVRAMKDSLEALGRFDPVRARERFLLGFEPNCTQQIFQNAVLVGFWVLKPQEPVWLLDHLYVLPGHQGQGIGAQVLVCVFAQADRAGKTLRLGALKGSRSNDFYLRHGFVKVGEGEWDLYYERQAMSVDCSDRGFIPAAPVQVRCVGPADQ